MKYYSEITKKLYDTEVALRVAEKKFGQEAEEKTKAYDEVKKAFNEAFNAKEKYHALRDKYVQKYGSIELENSNVKTQEEGASSKSFNDLLYEFFGIQ